MNYQSGDRLKNRYLSSDAFTSLKNKLGGRSITSLGNNRKRNSYKMSGQGFSLLDYKFFLYKIFISILLLIICIYVIPQTRYFIHGFMSQKNTYSDSFSENFSVNPLEYSTYNTAPSFLKTDLFISKQKDIYINDSTYVYDFFTNNLIGITENNSSSTINIKLFSDSGFKNNFLIEQRINNKDLLVSTTSDTENNLNLSSTSSNDQSVTEVSGNIFLENNFTYQSYVFEGLGYGQLMAKVPPMTEVKKNTFVYTKTIDGLKPVARIINIDEDNKSTFTIIHAQLISPPQNVYKVIFK